MSKIKEKDLVECEALWYKAATHSFEPCSDMISISEASTIRSSNGDLIVSCFLCTQFISEQKTEALERSAEKELDYEIIHSCSNGLTRTRW